MNEMHSFNTVFAEKYGIEEAIIFDHIYHWCIANKRNNINCKRLDGEDFDRYWTFNSYKYFSETFKYINISKVRRVMKELEDNGFIIVSNFNKAKYDQTNWYTVTQKGEEEYLNCCSTFTTTLFQNENSMMSNCKMDDVKMTHVSAQNDRPIPTSNTTSKPTSNTISSEEVKNEEKAEKKAYPKEYYAEVRKAYYENCKVLYERNCISSPTPVIPNAITKKIKQSFDEYGYEKVLNAVHNSIGNSWLISKGYPFSFIFGPNMLPNLINGGGLVQTEQSSAFAKAGKSDYDNNVW